MRGALAVMGCDCRECRADVERRSAGGGRSDERSKIVSFIVERAGGYELDTRFVLLEVAEDIRRGEHE